MDQLNFKRFSVEPWLVEPDLNQISDGARVVKLEPRTMDALVYLATHAGMVISREELLSIVWGDSFVAENTLSRTISRLRKALGDDWQHPRYLETISKTGYRWIHPVRTLHPAETLQVEEEEDEIPDGSRPKRIWRWVGLAVAVTLFMMGLVFWRSPKQALALDMVTEIRPAVTLPGRQANSVISPDGLHIAFAWQGTEGQNWDIYVQSLDADNPRRLTNDPAKEVVPAWSPDGRFLAFVAEDGDCGIFRVPLTGGPRVKMAECLKNPRNLNWSPDGLRLAFDVQSESGLQTLFWVSAEGGIPTPIVDPVPGSNGDWQPVFSPDGSKLAFQRRLNADLHHLFIHDFGKGTTQPITVHEVGRIRGFDWMADGRSLVYSFNPDGHFFLWRIGLDGGSPKRLPIFDDLVAYPRLARKANTLIYKTYTGGGDLFSLDLQETEGGAREPSPLVPSTRCELNPRVSLSNDRLAFLSNRTGPFELWSADNTGDQLICHSQLEGMIPGVMDWNPDGTSLVYSARWQGQSDLFLVDANSRSSRPLTETSFNEVNPRFSPDGTSLYYGSDQGGDWQIWKTDLIAGSHQPLTVDGGFYAQPDPSGGALFFTRLNQKGIFKLDFETGEVTEVWAGLGLGDWANWQIGANGLYFLHRPSGRIMFQPFVGVPHTIYQVSRAFSYLGPAFHVSPDESTIIFGQITQRDDEVMIVDFQ